jgi:protein-export membrane protein SecD
MNKLKAAGAKLGKFLFMPSPRGRVRRAFLGILILTLVAGAIDYPSGYNKFARSATEALSNVPVLNNFVIDELSEKPFNLGLDLQGGALLIYEADLSSGELVDDPEEQTFGNTSTTPVQGETKTEAMNRLRDRIERRVNGLGVSEPIIQVAGENRLVVQLAGVDTQTAIDRIGETPLLEFREQNNEPPRELTEEELELLETFNADQAAKAQEAAVRLSAGVEAFEEVAREISEDPSASEGGSIGGVTRLTHPELVEAAENTLIGKVVPGVLDAEDGYYVIRVDDRKEDDTEMLLSHILICYSGSANCQQDRTRQEALALANEVLEDLTPQNFEAKVAEFSDDATKEQNQGDLDWVAPATTVSAFQDGAKAVPVGEISEPIESDFGFHLVYKRDERPFGETFLSVIKLDKQEPADYLPEADEYKVTGLTGANVADARMVFDPQTNTPQISLQFDEEGTKLFRDLTSQYIGEPIAIYLDGQPISIPTVQTTITNGEAVITGQFSVAEARDLAQSLREGALPLEISLIQQQTVGASLGAESLQKSLQAAMVGLILVVIFMLLYYRLLGLLALGALMVYALVTLMLFKLIGVTLTLSGIAGFVLSLGMAVDANVLIFERFREERKDGKDLQAATVAAFDRAWPSIRDGNASTLITCLILAMQGTSVVQGFAITLGIGILVSMFSAIVVTKTFVRLIIAWPINKLTVLFGSGVRLKG